MLRPAKRQKTLQQTKTEIHVCTSSTCASRGSEGVVLEIEELGGLLEGINCEIKQTGCLGYCRRGPSALVLRKKSDDSKEILFIQSEIRGLKETMQLLEDATGKRPSYDNVDENKLKRLRRMRTRKHAKSIYRWNTALKGLREDVEDFPSLYNDYVELLNLSGFSNDDDDDDDDGKHFTKNKMPSKIEMYTKWSLVSVTPISKHSAVFSFRSEDHKRGSAHPTSSGQLPVPNTWHTTLLAEIGANDEGPLPWIERDYTPISTAKEWEEEGRVDLLVKIYSDGKATNWLKTRKLGEHVWLSRPIRTMSVPHLVTKDAAHSGFYPDSVLLLLAGTGIVCLPQILHHRNPKKNLAISTPKHYQLDVPIDLIASFREDDVLLYVSEIKKLCQGLRNCTVFLTNDGNDNTIIPPIPPPFPEDTATTTTTTTTECVMMKDLKNNVRILKNSRLNLDLIKESVKRMPEDCRVVISGPSSFNSTCREMLRGLVEDDHVTILSST